MTRRLLFLLASVCTAVVSSTTAFAQGGTLPDLGGFRAMLYTPVGALPTVTIVRPARDSVRRGWIAMEVGQYKERNTPQRFTNYGVSGQLKAWHGIAIGGTYGYHTCNAGCAGANMGSVDASGVIAHKTAKLQDDADAEVGWQVTAGFGKFKGDDISASSYTLLLPMSVILPQAYDGLLTLSVMPGIGYGSLVDNSGLVLGVPGTFSSARALIGAGIGYFFPAGLGIHATVHRVAVEESATQSGIIISWRF